MASYPLPPNPCLIAILLLVKTSSEPRIIFHYPPKPGEDNSHFRNMFKENSADDDSSSSSSDGDSQESSAEAAKLVKQQGDSGTGKNTPEIDETGSASPEKSDGLRGVKVKLQWNDLFGYQSNVLAKILLPAMSAHKKRFEVGLNDMVFLGRPIFGRPDGTWKKPRKLRRSSSKSNVTAEKVKDVQEQNRGPKLQTFDYTNKDSGTSGLDTGTESQPDSHRDEEILKEQAVEEGEPVEQTMDTKSNRTSKSDMLPSTKTKQKTLAMFHVVFVLRPPALEYHLRVKEMYDNITRKFSKAMKWEQTRSAYVAREAGVITSLTKHMDKSNSKTPLEIILTAAHMYRRNAKSSNVVSRHYLPVYSCQGYIDPLQQRYRFSNRPHQLGSGLVSVSPDSTPHIHINTSKCTRTPAARSLANNGQFHANR